MSRPVTADQRPARAGVTVTGTVTIDRVLLLRLAGVLTDSLSTRGHALQLVPWEGRGNCPPDGHSDRCAEYRALLLAVSDVIEAMDAAVVEQLPLIEAPDGAGEGMG